MSTTVRTNLGNFITEETQVISQPAAWSGLLSEFISAIVSCPNHSLMVTWEGRDLQGVTHSSFPVSWTSIRMEGVVLEMKH